MVRHASWNAIMQLFLQMAGLLPKCRDVLHDLHGNAFIMGVVGL